MCKCSFGVIKSKFSMPYSGSTTCGIFSNISDGLLKESILDWMLNGHSNLGSVSSYPCDAFLLQNLVIKKNLIHKGKLYTGALVGFALASFAFPTPSHFSAFMSFSFHSGQSVSFCFFCSATADALAALHLKKNFF